VRDGDGSVIHIDVSLKVRDLFLANLVLARFRLLLGLALSLTLVSALVITFVLIDEKQILLQTSPLFVGFPLFAVGAQILRLHGSCRKYVANLTPAQRRTSYMFSNDADGFDLSSGDSFAHISWNDVSRIVEKRRYLFIFLNKFDARVVPIEALEGPNELDGLRKIFSSKLGSRAQLLL